MEANEIRYHYTSVDALISILSTKKIWLTHCDDLSDKTEGRLLLQKIKRSLVRYNEIFALLTHNLYIACFCALSDSQSLWDQYGCVSIGFDFNAIWRDTKLVSDRCGTMRDTSGISIDECVYTNCNDESYSNVLDFVCEQLSNIDWNSISSQQYSLLSCSQCFILKPIEYKQECETRIFSHLWRKEPFIFNGKRYIEFHFSADKVTSIKINHSLCGYDDQRRITDFVKGNEEYSHVVVEFSK